MKRGGKPSDVVLRGLLSLEERRVWHALGRITMAHGPGMGPLEALEALERGRAAREPKSFPRRREPSCLRV